MDQTMNKMNIFVRNADLPIINGLFENASLSVSGDLRSSVKLSDMVVCVRSSVKLSDMVVCVLWIIDGDVVWVFGNKDLQLIVTSLTSGPRP